jgi:hypothetical protein
MRKILFALIFSIFLVFPFFSFQNVSSQTQKSGDKKNNSDTSEASVNTDPARETSDPILKDEDLEDSDHYSYKWLRNDMRVSDVVAYVDIKEVQYSDRSGDTADCENNKGGGYCFYRLKAEVKEVYKGKIETKTLELGASADASYPKKHFLGEQIVFLLWGEEDENKQRYLSKLENSSRYIKGNVLEKMRNIADPNSPVDESDELNPYSVAYIGKNFAEADAVVYVDVKSFKSFETSDYSTDKFALKANVKEVFKGGLKSGQTFEYLDDLLHRPMREEDLGEQILYLEKKEENGKIYYEKLDYTEGWIRHDILEKLRRIASERSDRKK